MVNALVSGSLQITYFFGDSVVLFKARADNCFNRFDEPILFGLYELALGLI